MKFNAHLQNLPIYEAGKPIELVTREFGIDPKDVIKLASNENPLGTSKKVISIIKEKASNASLYPDDSFYELKDALANLYKVSSKNIIIGSGSDQIIEFALHAKANEKSAILTAGITFAMYEIYAKHVGAKIYKTKSKEHNLKELKELYLAHKDEISIIFLCLPNNPLGECPDAKEVMDFISIVSEDTLVVTDCAYMEFAKFKDSKKAINPKELISKFKNTLYLGTFSKAYGLGGMRVGYGIANTEIITAIHKLRAPFNITTLSLAAALQALNDQKFIEKTLKNNLEEMKVYEKFAKKNGIEFIPSYTNFITFVFDKKQNASQIADNLLKKGIILRNLKSYGLNAIRITIGKKKQNKRVLAELKKEI
ncbi:histidinol-phosphate transaminase [Campylobacter hyointestinalis]|uniref:Histidinol-phosphate aminotransferase n=1 Tax=Campylobacter hyointestinalis subsp. hyointestinalis TaxID=91352 RepID=A0A855N682_CAMHY|nr:histidinol-phosphate transaminase [Campylobacter hyointestinalis]PPB57715.1 histidinol-phosphate transaminase [Campylobacter hyointestinalis subsp. hyointestinalis]PPB62551.1 histidinol-phosphate transaminase [Campylobacter hyointestinalis subsp. hyointestinalis]PPB71208.1 histidinol-phosphate transaminase [Campylobacter hyointestinalis subsp. hyointestinalis]